MKRVDGLEVYEDVAFQKKEWLFERCGWAFLLLIILAALLGLFGSGPLSRVSSQTDDGAIRVSFGRFLRWQTSQVIEIEFIQADLAHEVGISNELLKRWSLQKVTPEPDKVIPGKESTLYRFHGEGPARIQIEYQATKVGNTEGTLTFAEDRSLDVKQFALP